MLSGEGRRRPTGGEELRGNARHPSFIIRHSSFIEFALVFAAFFLIGASPVPDVNEPYYLGKAIHFWNPDWIRGDFFLDSFDTHRVFYVAFGWLSLWLSPWLLAWFGRTLTWALLAWAWQRLSFAIIPERWWAVLTAVLMVALNQWCQMAGEWVVGGVEAKGFAYVLVFLALAALIEGRWNGMWALLGAATAFHVLVGGWSAVAAALAWRSSRDRPPLRSLWPGLSAALLLALPGVLPSLASLRGVAAATLACSNQIYVYERLPHHLDFTQIPFWFKARFALLIGLTAALAWFLNLSKVMAYLRSRWLATLLSGRSIQPPSPPAARLLRFTGGALAIWCVGVAISLLSPADSAAAAGWLRFYWFRLADVIVPLCCALLGGLYIAHALQSRPRWGKTLLRMAVAVALFYLAGYAIQRPMPTVPRADRLPNYGAWWRACAWVAEPGHVPPQARFLTPRLAQTFKWYAGRAEVVNMKEIPQDAREIVLWWRRLVDIHGTGNKNPADRWHESLAELGAARLQELGAKYEAGYVITLVNPPLPLAVVYENETYVIYRLKGP